MLKQRNIEHKRKNSQLNLFHPNNYNDTIKSQQKNNQLYSSKPKVKKTTKEKQKFIYSQKSNQNKLKLSVNTNKQITDYSDKQLSQKEIQAKNILKLLQNSQKRISKKSTVVQDINDQNIDTSNGNNYIYSTPSQNYDNSDPYFQFGRKSRSSMQKNNQNFYPTYNSNNNYYNYLNMQEIAEVPDTMSNQRRYQNSNFYQFLTSQKNSLINFSNKLSDKKGVSKDNTAQQIEEDQRTYLDTKEKLKALKCNKAQISQPTNIQQVKRQIKKNLKQRKQKGPKNIIIENLQNQNKLDMTDLITQHKKTKNLDSKKSKSKSKQFLKKVERQKSGTSLLSNKKYKNMSHAALPKKKSLSLKNQKKSCILKLSQRGQTTSNRQKSQKTRYDQIPNKHKQIKNMQSIGQKIMMIQQSQSKLQNQYKVLWQCVGQLWQNSRITRYISQKNKSDIIKLQNNQKSQDQKLIKLKSQIISSISSARY